MQLYSFFTHKTRNIWKHSYGNQGPLTKDRQNYNQQHKKIINRSENLDRPNKYQKWQLSPSKTTKEKWYDSTIRNG